MATGTLSDGVCFETASEAADYHFSNVSPVSFYDPVLAQVGTVFYRKVASWQRCVEYGNGPVCSNVTFGEIPSRSCLSPTESFNLGVEYGWQFVAILVVAWGIHASARMLK